VQHWIDLAIGAIAAVAVIGSAFEGVRIWTSRRRSDG